MPQVRQYQPQVTQQALPGVRKSQVRSTQIDTPQIRFSPSAPAAQLGGQIAQLGQGMMADQARQAQEARQRADQVAIMEADRKTSQWITDRLYNPEGGAFTVKGKDAGALPEAVMGDFKKTSDEIRSTLTTQEQKDGFDRFIASRAEALYGDVSKHTARELAQYDDQETKAYIDTARQDAVLNSSDPDRVDLEIDRQVYAITAHAKATGTLGSEGFKSEIAAAKSSTHKEVLRRILAQGNDLEAKSRFGLVREHLNGKDITEVESWMKVGSTRGESQRLALKITGNGAWQASEDTSKQEGDFGITVTAGREMTLSEAMSEVDKIEDPDLQDATRDRVKASYSAYKETQNDLERQEATRVKGILDQQKAEKEQEKEALDQRMIAAGNKYVSGTFDKIPPDVEANLPIAMRNQLEAYAKRNMKGEEAATDPTVYYDLKKRAAADPNAFKKENLLKYMNKLSKGKLDELIGVQASIMKGDFESANKVLDGVRTNSQIITGTLRKAGIDPEDKNNKARVDNLWGQVDAQVDSLQRSTGKKVTNDDIQKITDRLLIQETTEKGSWWNILPGGKPFYDVTKPRFEVEPTVVNPKTGEKMVYRGGQWVKP